MTESAVTVAERESPAVIMERVITAGDLSKLTEAERVTYYFRVCESIGLNPLTKPFDYITLNGKLTLYPNKDAAAQLRRNQHISTTLRFEERGDMILVIASGVSPDGRRDEDVSGYSAKLNGDALIIATKKAVTQAKRRLALSMAGLGFLDESELEDVPQPAPAGPRPSLAERIAEKAAAIPPETLVAAAPAVFVQSDAPEPPAAVPAPRGAFSAAALASLARDAGKTKHEVATAIAMIRGGAVPTAAEVSDIVKAMSDEERRLLAVELNLDAGGAA